MPRDHSNAVVYKIARRDGEGDIYIGATSYLPTRRACHKRRCTDPKGFAFHTPVYEHIRANGGWDEWEVVAVEEFPCDNRTELARREREWVDRLAPRLNTYYPNAIEAAGGLTQYKLAPILCECGCSSSRNNLARHRQTRKHLRLLAAQQSL
jgi:hypothetical protein